MKKFVICKLCFVLIIGFSAISIADEKSDDLNLFQKLDKWVYDNIDVVGRKDEVTGARELNLTSVEKELKIGKQYFDQFVSEYKDKVLPEDDPRYQRVKVIFDRIIAVSHFAAMDTPELAVIDDPLWNAFATTGGRTIFFTGLTDSATDEEIAAVMGHEIAHSALSHITEAQWQNRVKKAFNKNNQQVGYEQAFNTLAEAEADRLGVLYAALAGYDPYAASRLWEKKEQSDPTVYRFYRTHPASIDRAKQSKANALMVLQYYRKDEMNPEWANVLACNNLYCPKEDRIKGGEGGGALGVLELVFNTGLKNYEAKQERERQEAEIAKQQQQDLLIPPTVEWHPSWQFKYQGTFQRFGQEQGVSFALSGDARQGSYFFVANNQINEGQMILIGQGDGGYWYSYADAFGEGKVWFREEGNVLSGALYDASGAKYGGVRGTRQ